MLEDLTQQLILQALTQPQPQMYTQTQYDESGRPYEVPIMAWGQSLASSWLSNSSTDEDRKRVLKAACNYLVRHPEVLANKLADAYVDAFRSSSDRFGGTYGIAILEVRHSVRDAAAQVLLQDEKFRERVVDMAHLSDSDSINIDIKLEPKKQ